ncbi:uncharacterized protein LOC144139102 [Haemaphysalis longicornis]
MNVTAHIARVFDRLAARTERPPIKSNAKAPAVRNTIRTPEEAVLLRTSTKRCKNVGSQGVTMAATRAKNFRKTPPGCGPSPLLLLVMFVLAVNLPSGVDGLRGCDEDACREHCGANGYDWSVCRFHPHYLMNGMSYCSCGYFFG